MEAQLNMHAICHRYSSLMTRYCARHSSAVLTRDKSPYDGKRIAIDLQKNYKMSIVGSHSSSSR